MKITLTTHDDVVHDLRSEPTRAEVKGGTCPHCKAAPFYVAGTGTSIGPDDRHYYAAGHCVECNEVIGVIRAYPKTIFGLTEDNAVLHGRPRVYW